MCRLGEVDWGLRPLFPRVSTLQGVNFEKLVSGLRALALRGVDVLGGSQDALGIAGFYDDRAFEAQTWLEPLQRSFKQFKTCFCTPAHSLTSTYP